jgi:hypothetical protein
MRRSKAHAEREIDAPAGDVYAVLADYQTHHPRIMPSTFSNLEVEEGGVGAGTVFHISLHALGQHRLHMRVDEPEPGRVLTETNLDTGVVTVFTVASDASFDRSLVRMSSEWETGCGVSGLVDRLMTPTLTRRTFEQELDELAAYIGTLNSRVRR